MICAMCLKEIPCNNGYFTTFINSQRRDFHIKCRPVFNYQVVKDDQQLSLQFQPTERRTSK